MKHDEDVEDDGSGGDGEQALQVSQQSQRKNDENANAWKKKKTQNVFDKLFHQ